MKRLAARLGMVVAALTLAAPACFGGDDGGAGGDFRAVRVSGSVTVQSPGEESRALEEGDVVPPGTSFKTDRGARVRLQSGGRAVELDEVTEATLLGSSRLSLEVGRVLAESPGARTLSFDSRGFSVQVTGGAARLERKLGRVSIGVYSGAAQVDLLGRGVKVPHLRQLDIAGAIATESEPSPLTLDGRDVWDRRLLGDVIDFDSNLLQYARGFNAEFGTEANSPQFFFSFVSYRNTRYFDALIGLLEPADILIGTIFAQQLAARGGDVRTHLSSMQRLRDKEATWGLIAKEHGLDLSRLLRAVLDAINRGTTPPQTNNNASGPEPGPTSSPRPTSRPRPRPTTSPEPEPSPEPTPTECSVLDRLLGTCDEEAASGDSGAGDTGGEQATSGSGCSVLGILIDPEC